MNGGNRDGTRDYAFYDAIDEPAQRMGWVVMPARRLLRRLLGPVWRRERELFQLLGTEIARLDERLLNPDGVTEVAIAARVTQLEQQVAVLAELPGRLDSLERQMQSIAALSWDHEAVVRRLAMIEDRLSTLQDGSAPAAPRRPGVA